MKTCFNTQLIVRINSFGFSLKCSWTHCTPQLHGFIYPAVVPPLLVWKSDLSVSRKHRPANQGRDSWAAKLNLQTGRGNQLWSESERFRRQVIMSFYWRQLVSGRRHWRQTCATGITATTVLSVCEIIISSWRCTQASFTQSRYEFCIWHCRHTCYCLPAEQRAPETIYFTVESQNVLHFRTKSPLSVHNLFSNVKKCEVFLNLFWYLWPP